MDSILLGTLTQTVPEIRRWKRSYFANGRKKKRFFGIISLGFASSAEWSEMQFEAIERTLTGYSFSEIELTPYFQLLNRSKPTLLSEEHWQSSKSRQLDH